MRTDPHSYFDDTQPRAESFEWRARVDFAARALHAEVTLRLAESDASAQGGPLDLDTRALRILAVEDEAGRPLAYELAPPQPILGSRLRVALPPRCRAVRVRYRTSQEASALGWLDAAQGGPFLFSQCQAIHARSVVPLQDTPSVRVRFHVRLEVPAGLRGLMAAGFVARHEAEGDLAVEEYRMEQPIPPYLFALAVGALEARELSPRSRVWAAPEVVERAAWEFADVEAMLGAGEALYGPYPWERFDVLVMPASFPYGGMENPRLTFVTPSLLAGDRSLVNVLAHELAHSWTGNLVTNANAEHFWLNEGCTVWAERRILDALPPPLGGPEVAELHAAVGRRDLERAFDDLRARPELQALRTHLDGVDPDEAFSVVPYEKGYLLLRAIEEAVGRPRFDAFMQAYLDRFRFGVATTEQFAALLDERLPGVRDRVALARFLDEPGLPETAPTPRSPRLDAILVLPDDALPPDELARSFNPTEWQLYLDSRGPAEDRREWCAALDDRHHLSDAANCEIAVSWIALAAPAGHAPAVACAERLVGEVGRMKYLKRLYLALAARPETRPLASACFQRHRAAYHPIARQVIDTVLRRHGVPTSTTNPVRLGRKTSPS